MSVRVVDQHVYRAEVAERPARRLCDLGRITKIGLQDERDASMTMHDARNFIELVTGTRKQRDARARTRERQRDRSADPTPRAGNQRRSVLESLGHEFSVWRWMRRSGSRRRNGWLLNPLLLPAVGRVRLRVLFGRRSRAFSDRRCMVICLRPRGRAGS
jgi:hypothetical protein